MRSFIFDVVVSVTAPLWIPLGIALFLGRVVVMAGYEFHNRILEWLTTD